ncbi:hypothetical protein EYC55_03075 [Xanthomonas oryzae]|nr:hypothetical protein [Xanthomonas oryzae]QBG94671.1 hypothetical protein EYC55_03075 [Xanthomonas oryzae]
MGARSDIRWCSAEQSNSAPVVADKALFKLATTACKAAKRDRRSCSWADAQFARLRAGACCWAAGLLGCWAAGLLGCWAAGLLGNRALRSSPHTCRLLTKN